MVLHAVRNAKRFYATASFIADTGLKSDAMDFGGSPLLFLWDKRPDGQWQSPRLQLTNERLSAERPPLLHRPLQSTRITHLLPPKPKTQTIPLPAPTH